MRRYPEILGGYKVTNNPGALSLPPSFFNRELYFWLKMDTTRCYFKKKWFVQKQKTEAASISFPSGM